MTFREWLDNRHNGKRHNGRTKTTAKAMGVSTVTIWTWAKSRVPAERVHQLSKVTDLTPHELRPDLFKEAAYQAECERQERLMRHEIEITKAKVGALHSAVAAAEAALGTEDVK